MKYMLLIYQNPESWDRCPIRIAPRYERRRRDRETSLTDPARLIDGGGWGAGRLVEHQDGPVRERRPGRHGPVPPEARRQSRRLLPGRIAEQPGGAHWSNLTPGRTRVLGRRSATRSWARLYAEMEARTAVSRTCCTGLRPQVTRRARAALRALRRPARRGAERCWPPRFSCPTGHAGEPAGRG